MFLMEPEPESDSEGNGNDNSTGSSGGLTSSVNLENITIPSTTTAVSLPSAQIDLQTQKELSRFSFSSKSASDISEMCCESVLWLSHRLGPVLTAKFLSRNLLRMLTLCYVGHLGQIDEVKSSGNSSGGTSARLHCSGDDYSKKVLDCLVEISDLYGDAFIERQYIPYCIDLINSATRKMTTTVESALLGGSALLERIFSYMPDALVTQLKDTLVRSLLTPMLILICSESTHFPSGYESRSLLASKTIGTLNIIRIKIGPDLTTLTLKPLILMMCDMFQATYNGTIKMEMVNVFGALLASQIFSNFCEVIVGCESESLIRDLYLQHQHGVAEGSLSMKEDASPSGEKASQKRTSGREQQSTFGSRSFGNRILIQENEPHHNESNVTNEHQESLASSKSRKDTSRHLKGNWLSYWEHEVGRSDTKQFNFKQIKLQSFSGHTGAVRSIYALDNENSFLSASKDKTVKLYSLRNQINGEETCSSAQWTYPHHKKAVMSVLFHEPLHLAASTDSQVHIWDPFVGKIVRILDRSSRTPSPICCLKPILHSCNFIAAAMDSTLHIVDVRTCQAYEMKIGIGQGTGLLRCMAVSNSGALVAVGHSSGVLSTLDLRNGSLLTSWKGHEGEILQLIIRPDCKYLISSSFDQNISVWNLEDSRLAFHMIGTTEPVHALCTHGSELISCTTSNKLGVHNGIDLNSDFSSTRLRSDTFRGIVTSMTLLPLNQFLLMGSDIGTISLLC